MRSYYLIPLTVLPIVTALAILVYTYGNEINTLLASPIAGSVLLVILIVVDGAGGVLVPFLIHQAEQPSPKLRIVFDVDKAPDRYSIQLDQMAVDGSGQVTVRRRFWRACVMNDGGLAERCKATLSLVKAEPPNVRKFILGEIQLVWESGQLYQDIGAKGGSEFVQVMYSDERTSGIAGDFKAFVSTPDGISQWVLPVFRAQDAMGSGSFVVELRITSPRDGASATKQFKLTTNGGWNDHTMVAL